LLLNVAESLSEHVNLWKWPCHGMNCFVQTWYS
jgi:hypothetical protein